jgi:hypothetical protein
MMIYKVKARFIEATLSEFFEKLTDGTIDNQLPDGHEIVDSMKRAKITGPQVIEWSEQCYCSPPLNHERTTVYDFYLTAIETEPIGKYVEMEGESFWAYMAK